MTVTPYATTEAHLTDHLERVRRQLTRHMVRYWYRLTDRQGTLSDAFVSVEEVRQLIVDGRLPKTGPPQHEERPLPTLTDARRELVHHQARIATRLEASAGSGLRFPIENLRAQLALDSLELDLVMLLAAIQIDLGIHRLASFAWADFSLKYPTLGFLAEVLTETRGDAARVHECALEHHILRKLRILELDTTDHLGRPLPLLLQRVRLSERILAFVRGWTPPEPIPAFDDLDLYCSLHTQSPDSLDDLGQPEHFVGTFRNASRQALRFARQDNDSHHRWLSRRIPLMLLVGMVDTDHAAVAHSCLGGARPILRIDLHRRLHRRRDMLVAQREPLERALACAIREARLLQATPLICLRDVLRERDLTDPRPLLDAIARVLPTAEGLVLLSVANPGAQLRDILGPVAELNVLPPSGDQRQDLWQRELDAQGAILPEAPLQELANRYTLTAGGIRDAAQRAFFDHRVQRSNRRKGEGKQILRTQDLERAVRQQIEHNLGLLAEPFSTSLTWDDIVLDPETLSRLQEMVDFGHNLRKVHNDWGFSKLDSYGRGLTALFAGPPGTGKTLSAAIIARELGRELFMVDLSRMVDKYIGETEKNIGRIFDEAERSNVVLLFDEADSLFGKRTSVRSATDRYANMEVNYLLQRMEHFDGTSILTTNLAMDMDEALARRLKFRLTFKMPDEEARESIWQKMIPPQAPMSGEVPWWRLAEAFELTPGHIKNSVMRAAFRAAQDNTPITFKILWESAAVEYRELGYLVQDHAPETKKKRR